MAVWTAHIRDQRVLGPLDKCPPDSAPPARRAAERMVDLQVLASQVRASAPRGHRGHSYREDPTESLVDPIVEGVTVIGLLHPIIAHIHGLPLPLIYRHLPRAGR